MQFRKKILSYFLLTTYLLVVLHHSVSHSHALEVVESKTLATSHNHEDFEAVHHEHHFHVGIFHFLGHLFENISHSNDFADEHLVLSQNTTTQKNLDFNPPLTIYSDGNSLVVSKVDAESLPAPPYPLFLLPRLKQPNTPLRAPPFTV